MKNFEKYKGAQERLCAALDWCRRNNRKANVVNAMIWLDLEAEEEKPLPCPFCGCAVHPYKAEIGFCVNCDHCGYLAGNGGCSENDAIAAHNRVAKAVMDAKAGGKGKEANDGR